MDPRRGGELLKHLVRVAKLPVSDEKIKQVNILDQEELITGDDSISNPIIERNKLFGQNLDASKNEMGSAMAREYFMKLSVPQQRRVFRLGLRSQQEGNLKRVRDRLANLFLESQTFDFRKSDPENIFESFSKLFIGLERAQYRSFLRRLEHFIDPELLDAEVQSSVRRSIEALENGNEERVVQ